MTNTVIKNTAMPRVSVKAQTFAAVVAAAAAVALPQLFHMAGAALGLGTAIGETLLPMHLPVILVGLLAGPWAGAIAGFLAPLVSYGLTGMPMLAMLPFLTIEICVYGLSAGLLRNLKLPAVGKVLGVQFAGRLVRAGAILLAFYVIGSTKVAPAIIWTSIKAGLPGLILQWVLIPAILWCVERARNREN